MLLGCIGDDFTGSSDLGNTFPIKDAVHRSLEALEWLRAQGCQKYPFKYRSTPHGNIGPVARVLADAQEVLVCPGFPATGRSVYQCHRLFGDRLFNESGMENLPLTLVTDSDIRCWLDLQIKGTVGHVSASVAVKHADAVRSVMQSDRAKGHRMIAVVVTSDHDLRGLGFATKDHPLLTGGSCIAIGLAALPDLKIEARDEIAKAIDYAATVGMGSVHLMAGRTQGEVAGDQFRDNLIYACGPVAPHGVDVLIEPINTRDVPDNLLSSTVHAERVITDASQPNVKLMFDCYHLQIMQGDLAASLKRLFPKIGHIKIAEVPDRGEPDAREFNYPWLIQYLKDLGYADHFRAEYKPRGDATKASAREK